LTKPGSRGITRDFAGIIRLLRRVARDTACVFPKSDLGPRPKLQFLRHAIVNIAQRSAFNHVGRQVFTCVVSSVSAGTETVRKSILRFWLLPKALSTVKPTNLSQLRNHCRRPICENARANMSAISDEIGEFPAENAGPPQQNSERRHSETSARNYRISGWSSPETNLQAGSADNTSGKTVSL
jgi:hypothetical protein